MFHEVVTARSWISAKGFMDGIAFGQITPDPIVITSTFVGYQVAGLAGAVVATLCIFMPSLLVLLVAEPWFERPQSSAMFRAATHGALLSFVKGAAHVGDDPVRQSDAVGVADGDHRYGRAHGSAAQGRRRIYVRRSG
jgi:hypothetical protein